MRRAIWNRLEKRKILVEREFIERIHVPLNSFSRNSLADYRIVNSEFGKNTCINMKKYIIFTLIMTTVFLMGCGSKAVPETNPEMTEETDVQTEAQTDKIEDTEAETGELMIEPVTVKVTVKEIFEGEGDVDGSFLAVDQDGEEVIYHYGAETLLEIEPGNVAVDDQLEIQYSGVLARSMPPQAYALEIRAVQ